MSFLAQLRQQAGAEQKFQLCYLLRVSRSTQRARLSLGLGELYRGRLVSHKPYLIQAQHLQRPPPFLDAVDTLAIQALVDDSAVWFKHSCGAVPIHNSATFLQALIETKRCFIETRKANWLPVAAETEQAVTLAWAIDEAGDQQLRWRSSSQDDQFYSGSSPFVYAIDAQTCRLGLGTSELSIEAIAAAMSVDPVVQATSVTLFLLQHQHHWQQLGLPLPQNLPCRDVSISLKPVLRCSTLAATVSDGATRDIIQLEFRYSSEHYCITQAAIESGTNNIYWDGRSLVRLNRDSESEALIQQQLMLLLSALDSNPSNRYTWHADTTSVWQTLLTTKRKQLESLGFQFVIDANFRHHYVIADNWQVLIDDSDDHSCAVRLQLDVDGEVIDLTALLAELHDFNRALAIDEPVSLALADGRLLLLEADQWNGIVDNLGDCFSRSSRKFRFCESQSYRLHDLQQQLPTTTDWRGDIELLDRAVSLHQSPVILQNTLNSVQARLRPYQWLGVCWLQHLKRHRVNGLLADDMGLGKTLQTLAHLSLEQQQGRLAQPALIIAPTSLLYNWAAEIERFTPHLRHRVIHGPQRHQYWAKLNDYDIVISSYQSVVNDLTRWQQQTLSWIILDEAQLIKNPRTRVSQAVREIDSDHRLCLSGTPVENHLGELWSLLDFLNPGCLGSRSSFKRGYQNPIEQDGNSARMQQLLSRIAPFMLRRHKDQVAKDLPAKTEIYQTISLGDDQQALYDDIKSNGWTALQQQLPDTSNSGQQQILLLTALLKLRQVCCDPRLLTDTPVSSAKREHCIAMIAELVAENRAVLVFSQFTQMLDLLAQDLQRLGIDYLMLTGKSRNRQQLVESFQQGESAVFLISLKAGGVGLNLTRADTVIHYDPWWNNAAEQQATDRAHRIGQDKPVFVYKLIAENTIEQKIMQLQQRKALLSQHVNQQAQTNAKDFAVKLEDLLALWQDEPPTQG